MADDVSMLGIQGVWDAIVFSLVVAIALSLLFTWPNP